MNKLAVGAPQVDQAPASKLLYEIAGEPQNTPYPSGSRGAPLLACAPGKVVALRQSTPPPPPVIDPTDNDQRNYLVVEQAPQELCGYLHLLAVPVEELFDAGAVHRVTLRVGIEREFDPQTGIWLETSNYPHGVVEAVGYQDAEIPFDFGR